MGAHAEIGEKAVLKLEQIADALGDVFGLNAVEFKHKKDVEYPTGPLSRIRRNHLDP